VLKTGKIGECFGGEDCFRRKKKTPPWKVRNREGEKPDDVAERDYKLKRSKKQQQLRGKREIDLSRRKSQGRRRRG